MWLRDRRGERGRQHFIKLTREEEESFLYVGSNGSLRNELQQALMRLVNEGWTAEGEIAVEFDGQGEKVNDAPFLTEPVIIDPPDLAPVDVGRVTRSSTAIRSPSR